MWRLWRQRWRGKTVAGTENGRKAQALSNEAAYRLAVAHWREATIEARGDRLSELARKAMGGRR